MSFTILIVEDNEAVRRLIVRILHRSGLMINEIHEADTGLLALEILKNHNIDFALIDLHLPGMNGEELVKKIVSDPETAKLPFIFISGETRPEYIEALKKKSFGFISKPFSPEILTPTIVDMLSRPYR